GRNRGSDRRSWRGAVYRHCRTHRCQFCRTGRCRRRRSHLQRIGIRRLLQCGGCDMMAPVTNLDSLQRTVAHVLTLLPLIHVPVLTAVGWWLGYNVTTVFGVSLLFAAVPAILLFLKRPIVVVAAALAVTLVAQTSLLVFLMQGHPWQVEMHFYYFALLAM